MKRALLSAFLFILLPCLSFADETGSVRSFPAQFPNDPRFGGPPGIGQMEDQQIMQETLYIIKEMVSVMKEMPNLEPRQKERLESLSGRMDFLMMRQQDALTRQRMGRP